MHISAISFSITARIIVTIEQILQLQYFKSLKSNKTAHKMLIAPQKFKKIFKKCKFVRFCKKIFDEDNFDIF